MGLDVGSVYGTLGAKLDDDGFDRFDRRLDKARRDTAKPIEAELKADVHEQGFSKWDQRLDKAERRTLQAIDRQGTGTAAAAGAIAAGNDRIDESGRRAHRSTGLLSGGLGGLAAKAAGPAAALAGVGVAFAAVIKAGSGFEKTMSEVAAVTGASKGELEQLGSAARKMGTETGLGAGKAAQAVAELAKGGLTTTQILEGGLAGALGLANAGSLELADAATATANALNLFGLDGDQATHVADAFATAANATTADVSDFALALTQGGGAAKAAGLSFDETTAFLEAMAAAGVKGSDAGTSVKSALTQLASPTKESAALMEKLGIDLFDANGNMEKLPKIAGILQDKLGGLTKEQRLNAASTIAGTDGMRALLALYDAGPDKVKGYEDGLKKQGTAADVAKEKTNNFAGAGNRLKASLENVSIGIFQKLSPSLTKGLDAVSGFINGLGDGDTKAGRFGRKVRDIAGDVGNVLTRALGVGKRALEAVGDVIADNRDHLEGIGRNLATYGRTVGRLLSGIGKAFADTFGGDSGAGKDVKTIIRFLTGLQEVMTGVYVSVVKRAMPGILQTFQGAAKIIRGVIRVIAGVLTGDFGKAWDGVKDIFGGAIKAIGGIVRAGTAPIRAAAAAIGKAVGGAFSAAWNTITGTATGFVNRVIDVINIIPGVEIKHVGKSKSVDTAGIDNYTPSRQRHGGAASARQGGRLTEPVVIYGEEAPDHAEWVIPENPAYASRARRLWALAGRAIGATHDDLEGFAHGGRAAHDERRRKRRAEAQGELAYRGPGEPLERDELRRLEAAATPARGYFLGGLNPGKALKFVEGLPGKAIKTVAGFVGKIADKLPSPPGGLLAGTYRYVRDKALDFVGDKAGGILKLAKEGAEALVGGGGGAGTAGLVPQVKRAIAWARAHGWRGRISSGFRSFAEQTRLWNNRANNPYPVARPGTSNHEGGQAVDVTDPDGFRRALQGAPADSTLRWFGPGDRIHFSVTGGRRGGRVARAARRAISTGGERTAGLLGFKKGGRSTRGIRAGSAQGFGRGTGGSNAGAVNRGVTRSLARAERGIAPYETDIRKMEDAYTRADRRFDLSEEEFTVENEDGTVTVDKAAVDARTGELDELRRMRVAIGEKIREYRAALSVAIKAMRAEVRRLQAAIKASPGKARAKARQSYRDRIADVKARITELGGVRDDLAGDVADNTLDLSELDKERGEVAGSSAPPADRSTFTKEQETTLGGFDAADTLAAGTPDKGDDLKALEGRRDFLKPLLDDAIARGDNEAIVDLGGQVNSVNEAIEGLTGTGAQLQHFDALDALAKLTPETTDDLDALTKRRDFLKPLLDAAVARGDDQAITDLAGSIAGLNDAIAGLQGATASIGSDGSSIAEQVVSALAAFNAGRADLFAQFGNNFTSPAMLAAGGPLAAAAGARYFGAAAGDLAAPASSGDARDGRRGVKIDKVELNAIVTPAPPDPHTFAKTTLHELQAAI